MTSRERRLRERIDTLTGERDRYRGLYQGRGKATRRCVYCSAPTRTTRIVAACSSHRDLVEVDPNYSEAVYP